MMLELTDIRKTYRLGPIEVEVLKELNLGVDHGEFVSIIGSSGCGKSTLMNIIGLLDKPTTGRHTMEGREIAHLSDDELSRIRNLRIGFVFQSFHLLPRLSALANVCIPLMYRGTPERERVGMARAMLNRVGMGDRESHRPTELSGGQQQRVAIARALVGKPSLLLADEPTGALDTEVGQSIMDLFLELNSTESITTVIITHDPGIARQCRRVVRMRDGRLID